jgi:hypothetical protein
MIELTLGAAAGGVDDEGGYSAGLRRKSIRLDLYWFREMARDPTPTPSKAGF